MSENQKDPQYKLRWPAELRDKISESAKQNNRSMNAEIIKRLNDSFPSIHRSSADFLSSIDLDDSEIRESNDYLTPKDVLKILQEIQKIQKQVSETAQELKKKVQE